MDAFSDYPLLPALMTALGVGLMIGTVRERAHAETFAGVRTHALTAMAAVLATSLGTGAFLMLLAMLVALVAVAYWRSSRHDVGLASRIDVHVQAPGLTTARSPSRYGVHEHARCPPAQLRRRPARA